MKKPTALILIATLTSLTVVCAWAWEIERPSANRQYFEKETVRMENSNGEASAGLGVQIYDYEENRFAYGNSSFGLNVSMTANSRAGIYYSHSWEDIWWIDEGSLYSRIDRNAVGDEWGEWCDIPTEFYAFRFYGGPGSGQYYTKVWISSNGFIDFDPINLTCPDPHGYFSSPNRPNAVVAAVWSDLVVDSQASIITGVYLSCNFYYFVIMWKNVKDKTFNQRLTFEIILREEYRYCQSDIWISYRDVKAIGAYFAVGIEDLLCEKPDGMLYSGSALAAFNGQTVHYYQYSPTYYLNRLAISFADTCTSTRLRIDPSEVFIRGYHIAWSNPELAEPDSQYRFVVALAGSATLLLGACASCLPPPGGIIIAAGCFGVDSFLVYMDWVDVLAHYQYSHIQRSVLRDQFSTPSIRRGAYIEVPTQFECVDASLCIYFYWVLDDPHDAAHCLTITATAMYSAYSVYGQFIRNDTVSTSVDLNVAPDAGNSRSSARVVTFTPIEYKAFAGVGVLAPGFDDPDDFYRINVPEDYMLTICMVPPANTTFDLYLYYENNARPVAASISSEWGIPKFISYEGFGGTYYIRVKAEGIIGWGMYDLSINLQYREVGPPPHGPL